MSEDNLHPAPPGTRRLCVMRDGHAVVREWEIPYTSRSRILATERAASWLSKHFTYWWLEQNGHTRTLIDSDGL